MTEGKINTGGFGGFFTTRVIGGIVLAVVALWAVWYVSDRFGGDNTSHNVESEGEVSMEMENGDREIARLLNQDDASSDAFPLEDEGDSGHDAGMETGHALAEGPDPFAKPGETDTSDFPLEEEGVVHEEEAPMEVSTHRPVQEPVVEHTPKATGVHLIEATVGVLDYELNERFWGWRRNDLIRFTDNVEQMQLGILEVVRRTSVVLMEKISRHGVSAAIDQNLENAMNWLMIKPDRYWLPSAEEKYNDSVKELKQYALKLERGEARFYVRTDNLIPLLTSLAELAGSCDENLVKSNEDDGSPVSWFKADDYFYYAKGVAMAMGDILHAVQIDFASVLEARQGMDLLNRAMHACHVAAHLSPWVVTDASLDGILANHRANMAAEISHLRYFLNGLATALET